MSRRADVALAHDLVGCGTLLAERRAEDLAADHPTFLGVLRPPLDR